MKRGIKIIRLLKLILLILPLITCETFDWAAFNQGLQAAKEVELRQALEGSIIIAEDGTYLGKITNKYSSESIFNDYGTFGSLYSSKSIWNEYGTYGSPYSSYSPFNKYTSTPPGIYKDGTLIGYLTVNKYITGAINPYALKSLFD